MNAKQKRTLGFLLLALVAVVALLLVVVALKDKKDPTGQGDGSAVSTPQEPAAYTSFTYFNGSATLSFQVDEKGAWYWVDDPDFPLSDGPVVEIVNLVSSLKPLQSFAPGDTAESYGLDNPAMTVNAQGADGDTLLLELGSATPTDATHRYLRMNGDETTVYVVDSTLPDALTRTIYSMMELPKLPTLTEEAIVSLTVQGAVTTSLRTQIDLAEKEAGDSSAAASGENMSTAVTWYAGEQEQKDVTGNAQLTALVNEITGMQFLSCKDYKPSTQAVSICGLYEPSARLKVAYIDATGVDKTLELRVGGKSADGDGYYAMWNDDTTIYCLAESQVEALLAVAQSGLGA